MHRGGALEELAASRLFCFFFNDTATTEIYTLSLHDALPICEGHHPSGPHALQSHQCERRFHVVERPACALRPGCGNLGRDGRNPLAARRRRDAEKCRRRPDFEDRRTSLRCVQCLAFSSRQLRWLLRRCRVSSARAANTLSKWTASPSSSWARRSTIPAAGPGPWKESGRSSRISTATRWRSRSIGSTLNPNRGSS